MQPETNVSPVQDLGPRRFMKERREELTSLSFDHFDVAPASPTIGAEVRGIDLGKPLSESALGELRKALLEFKVLFFRGQRLSTGEHVAFARCFGELEVHPFLPSNTDFPELVRFEKDEGTVGAENLWHSDVSWRIEPSLGSILRCVKAPPVGGDTLFSDMAAAYHGLPQATRERIDGLHAIHDFTHSFGRALDPEALAERQKEFPPARHPVVRTHPETGEKILYVNRIFTSHIEELEPAESESLLTELCATALTPEYQCRLRWEDDSIAFWDNRSTQHYASSDYWPQTRIMERATVIGDRPV